MLCVRLKCNINDDSILKKLKSENLLTHTLLLELI